MDSFDKTLGGMVVKRRRDQRGEEEDMKMERRASCPSAASLYTFPTQSSSVDASSGPVVFTWNAACLDPTITNVDLKLYAPELEKPIIKVWTGIPASDGSYSTTLLPKWWNSTSSIQLQVTLSDSNNLGLSFLSSTVAGPVFEVTYPQEKLVTVLQGGSTVAAAPADTAVVDSIYTTASILSSDGGLNAGSVFAAVFFPIVILLAGIFVYVRWARAKQSKKRERWSKAIDNRMSVISTSWNPTSPDPRKSISSAARRTQVGSVYSTSPYDGRPSQSSSHLRDPSSPSPQQEMSQTSFARPATSVFLATGEQRASRVSFAFVDTPNSRVSFAEGSSPRGQESFARGGRGVSQVGTGRPSISIYSTTDGTKQAAGGRGRDSSEEMVSPDQAAGPWVLGNEEEVEEELSSMAAVRMMNGSHNPSGSYSSLTAPNAALRFPSPAHTLPNINTQTQTPSSPYFPNSTPNSAQAFSPDAMLRNYASGGGQTAGRRMTVLGKPGENNPFRKSMAGEVGDEYGQAR